MSSTDRRRGGYRRPVRPVRIDGNVAYVTLTKGYEAIVDIEDVPFVSQFNWCAHEQAHTVYARRHNLSGEAPLTIYMHRELVGASCHEEADHRDGNGLNNRRENLRKATRTQNNQNRRYEREKTGGLRGVCLLKSAKKWQSRIGFNGETIHLGLFDSKEEAHEAYLIARARLHGEFCRPT